MQKNGFVRCLIMFIFFSSVSVPSGAADPYKELAEQLSKCASSLKNKKVAVIPFSYVDGRESSDGIIVSERITTQIVNLGQLEVIERSQLEKILKELDLQISGVVDSKTANELGRILGVEALITGSLIPKKHGDLEINARVISTETAKVITAYSIDIEKDWEDKSDVSEYPGVEPVSPVNPSLRTEPAVAPVAGEWEGFFDLFIGKGISTMDLKFSRDWPPLSKSELGLQGSFPDGFTSISWKDLKTITSAPIGLRMGGFGKNFGLAMDLFYVSCAIAKQETTFWLNDIQQGGFSFVTDDYFKVKVLSIIMEIFLRIPVSIVDLYGGIGLGVSFNIWEAPTVNGYTESQSFSAPSKETDIGFLVGFPVGMRLHLSNSVALLVEWRWFINYFSFTRNIENENDSTILDMNHILLGLSFTL